MPATGFYQFDLIVHFNNNASSPNTLLPITICLFKGGSPFYIYEFAHTTTLGSKGFSAMIYLTLNDVIDARVINQSGTTIGIDGFPSNVYTYFSGHKVD